MDDCDMRHENDIEGPHARKADLGEPYGKSGQFVHGVCGVLYNSFFHARMEKKFGTDGQWIEMEFRSSHQNEIKPHPLV